MWRSNLILHYNTQIQHLLPGICRHKYQLVKSQWTVLKWKPFQKKQDFFSPNIMVIVGKYWSFLAFKPIVSLGFLSVVVNFGLPRLRDLKAPWEVCVCMLSHFSRSLLFATLPARLLCPWDSQQEYWNGLPCPPPGDFPHPVIGLKSPVAPALQVDSLPTEPPGKPMRGTRIS